MIKEQEEGGEEKEEEVCHIRDSWHQAEGMVAEAAGSSLLQLQRGN